ncbi:F-box domain-containing protein [Mycena venus]|uniref:F-box domain-containing protein n=1 Tax=Mycena venus TaxID=2733690 RepID=A0A8H6Z483_9AGAR|nr:F-box domain-containing protein [Mycena venus]
MNTVILPSDTPATLHSAQSPFHITSIPPEILAEIFLICCKDALVSAASIADVHRAPMLLTLVSSHWRGICLSTRRLWDNLNFRVTPTSMPPPRLRPPDNGEVRHAPSSCIPRDHASNVACIASVLTANIGCAVQAQDRLKQLSLDISSSDIPTAFWGQSRILPLLSSVVIKFKDTEVCDFEMDSTVVRLFKTTPCLREVAIRAHDPPAAFWAFSFTWSELAVLSLRIHPSLGEGRAIPIQCPRLRVFDVLLFQEDEDSNMQPSKSICYFRDLWDLTIIFDLSLHGEELLPLFFEPFALPSLRDLCIGSHAGLARILPELYNRAPFKLQNLVLMELDLTTDNIIPFLKLVPTLQTIHLECFDFNDTTFADFTFDPCAPVPSLTLPLLTSLAFANMEYDPNEIRFHRDIFASSAESVSQYRDGCNTAFPLVAYLDIFLNWTPSDSDVERRLVEASSTGVTVRYSRVDNRLFPTD